MKKIFSSVILAFLLVVLTHCSGSKKVVQPVVEAEVKPEWVTQRPVNPDYYVGIAVSSKSANPTTYAQVAQRNALNELASEIEVKVKSNSMLFSFEDHTRFTDDFKEFVQVEANQHLENYEQVASYENATEYWVYYRLSKSQFEKDKNERINLAVNKSLTILEQASKQWSLGQYKNGMKLYFDALIPIEPYLGEPLQVTLNGTKDVYLGNFILTQISQVAREFRVKPVSSKLNTHWGGAVSRQELTFLVRDSDGNNLAQIPVNFTYSEGIIRPRNGVSANDGKVSTQIKKISTTKNRQTVTAQIDFKTLVLGAQKPDEIFTQILKNIEANKTVIEMTVTPPVLLVVSEEKSFGTAKSSELQTAFANEASQQGFMITQNKRNATLVVNITADTREAGQSYDLKNSLLNGSVKITEVENNAVVYQDQFNNLKGVSTTYQKASTEAYAKAKTQITDKIVSRFYRNYLK